MSGELHQISAEIGGIRALMAQSAQERREIAEKIDRALSCLQRLSGRLDGHDSALADIKPKVEALHSLKQRGLGVVAALIFVGTLVGNATLTALGKLGAILGTHP